MDLGQLENNALKELMKKLKMFENDAKFIDALFNGYLITLLNRVQDKLTFTNVNTGEIYVLTKVRDKKSNEEDDN